MVFLACDTTNTNTNTEEDTLNLKELREKEGMTQIDVANAIGVSVGAYRIWEQGGGNPKQENLDRINKLFKTNFTLPNARFWGGLDLTK